MKKLLFITASIMAIILVFVVIRFGSFWLDSNKGATATSGPVKTPVNTPINTPSKGNETGAEQTSPTPYLFFKPNGGVGGCTLYLKENEQNVDKIPENIVYREGYKLKGWNTKSDGTGETITSLSAAGPSTLYAIWEKDTQTDENVQKLAYASNFLGEGGCMQYFSKQEQFPYTILEPMVVDSESKYAFLYWNTHEDGSGKTFYPGDVIHSLAEINPEGNSAVLYAVWDDPEDTINRLNWDFWLEYLDSRDDSYYGKAHLAGGGFGYYTIKEAPEGKKNFLYWNTEPDGSGTAFQPGDIVFSTSEIGGTTLYAIWE